MRKVANVEVTSIGWICGGLIVAAMLFGAISSIFSGESDVGEGIATGCLGGPGCLIVVVVYLLWAHPDNPFIRLAQAPPPQAVSAPAANESKFSRPDYLLSPPKNLELDYNYDDGSGRISWDASRWMPTKPSFDSRIEYEIFVDYPDNRMGPYTTDKNSFHFDYLNADNTGGVRIEVKAVGTIRDGNNEFRYPGGIVKTTWTPTED